jgi:hypothetical protein
VSRRLSGWVTAAFGRFDGLASGAALGRLGGADGQTLVWHIQQLDRPSVLVAELDEGARRDELLDNTDRACGPRRLTKVDGPRGGPDCSSLVRLSVMTRAVGDAVRPRGHTTTVIRLAFVQLMTL